MKVLILNYEFPPLGGGAANATYFLLKEFANQEGIEIDLVTSSVDEFRIDPFAPNINIHYLDIGKKGNLHYQSNKDLLSYSWTAYRYAQELVDNNDYQLTHAFFGIPCGYIAMRLGIPYIVSLRGSDVPFYNKRFEKLDKFLFQRLSKKIWEKSAAVITNSSGLKDLALDTAPNQAIDIIWNGVDTDNFVPLKNKTVSSPITLVSTGRLIERKGYQFLIEALKGMDNFKLVLVGDGNMMEELKTQAKESKVQVEFLD